MQRYSPDGRLLAEYPTPARCPTMVAFGGPDLKTLYVTSARTGRPAAELADCPHSGSLFSMRVDVARSARTPFRPDRLKPGTPMSDYSSVQYRSLANRSVVVTGGASGIGEEMVQAFAAQGARVAFLDIDSARGEALAAQTGASLSCLRSDRHPMLARALARIDEQQDGIEVLVNNAGRTIVTTSTDVEPDYWRRALALNLDHQFFATQAVSKRMGGGGRGSVIMLGSISWMRGRPGMVGYTTAKAAINGMTRTLARELGPSGIRVNCIVPGAILTERQRTALADARAQPAIHRLAGLEVPVGC